MVSVPGAGTSSTAKRAFIGSGLKYTYEGENPVITQVLQLQDSVLLCYKLKKNLASLAFNQNRIFSRQHWGQAT